MLRNLLLPHTAVFVVW